MQPTLPLTKTFGKRKQVSGKATGQGSRIEFLSATKKVHAAVLRQVLSASQHKYPQQ